MAHDEHFFAPAEHAQAEALDRLIDERLRARAFLAPEQRDSAHETAESLLIRDLSRFYQPQADEILAHLHRARERVEQRSPPSLAPRPQQPTPLTRLRSLREGRNHMKTPRSLWDQAQGPSRPAALAASLLLTVLVGSLVIGMMLARSGASTPAHPTPSALMQTPGATPFPTKLAPTQTPASVPGIQGLVGIHMLDAINGWAVTGQNHILRTTDGANHWEDVTPPSMDPPQANYPNLTVDFLSPSVAWVYSFVLDANDTGGTTKYYRTTNGGRLWLSTVSQGDVPGQIRFTDSTDGWMYCFLGVAAGSSAVDIFRTTNGGATWTKVASASPSTANQPSALPFDGDKTGIGARDAMTAWVAGSDAKLSFVWLYVTHDGGATWQHQTLPLPSSFSGQVGTSPPTFFTAQDGMLPVLFRGASSESGAAYVTHDGGATWQETPLLEAGEFDFINATQGWATNGAATAGSTLYATRDGGQHWTKLPANQTFHDVSSLNFVSAEIGWAIEISQVGPGPSSLLKTTDGGMTWAVVPYPSS